MRGKEWEEVEAGIEMTNDSENFKIKFKKFHGGPTQCQIPCPILNGQLFHLKIY